MKLGPLVKAINPETLGEDLIYYLAMRELEMPEFMAVMTIRGLASGHIVTYLKELNKRCPWIAEATKLEDNRSVYLKYKSDRGRLDEATIWSDDTLKTANDFIIKFFEEI